MRPRRIELHLGQLVLEGIAPEQRRRVIASLEQELALRLRQGELPRSRAQVVGPGPREGVPEALGAQLARTIT